MTTANVLTKPQPKVDPKRTPPAPTRRDQETPEASAPDTDDRWAHMPCTD